MVKNLGTFQDGGLQNNNPIVIARSESLFLWPEKGEPDFALSLGTGTTSMPTAASTQSPVTDRFYLRLFKSFMRSLDSEEAWKRFIYTIPVQYRSRYHRLNLYLQGPEPPLDDLSTVGELKTQTMEYIKSSSTIPTIMDSMYAAMFYFELEDLPRFINGRYECVGHIFCRLNLPPNGRQYLYSQLIATSSWFLIHGHPTACVLKVLKGHPPFKRRVQFVVDTLSESIAISIRGITSMPRLISGFPISLKNLIDSQQLYAPFGRADHSTLGKLLPSIPAKRKIDKL